MNPMHTAQPTPLHDRPLLLAAAVNVAGFLLLALLLQPVYGTVEDVYVLYQLAGGFGTAPSALVHYNHIMNPLLGYPLCWLFGAAPSVNWYSAALLLGHFFSGTTILYCLLRAAPRLPALLLFAAYFCVFEARSFDSLNFTNTALLLVLSGLLLLLTESRLDRMRRKTVMSAVLLIAAGSLFRIHSWLPLLPLFVPFLFALNDGKRRLRVAAITVAALVLVLLLHGFRRLQYNRALPGWKAEEAYRQQVYGFYNNRNIRFPAASEKNYLESEMLRQGLVADGALLTPKVLCELAANTAAPAARIRVNRWLFVNNRIFFLTLLLPLLFVTTKRVLILWGAATLTVLVLWLGLQWFFGKAPDYLLQGMLATVFLATLCSNVRWRTTPVLLLLLPLLLA
ncbi:MAG: hypothetical protein EOP50_16730, partial [Sphingobacteriales bacterium]